MLIGMGVEKSITAVCFDLGGVLARLAGSWREAVRWAGLPTTADPRLEEPFFAFEPYNIHELGKMSHADYFEALRVFLGLPTVEEARQAHLWVLGEPYPGMLPIVEGLKARGVRTGCLSNTEAMHWERMTSDFYPAIQALEVKGASHLLRARKPDAAIFQAFEAFSGFERESTVFFDDTSGHVEAAKAFGWRAVRIDPSGDTAAQVREVLAEFGVRV